MFDFSKLKGRIREKNLSQHSLAQKIGITDNALSFKLNGKSYFTAKEINDICSILGIDQDDISVYFFTVKV